MLHEVFMYTSLILTIEECKLLCTVTAIVNELYLGNGFLVRKLPKLTAIISYV